MCAKKSALVLLLACAALLGCAPQIHNQDVATGLLEISLTDAPPDLNVEKALVTISSVQVHLASEEEAPDEETEAGWFMAGEICPMLMSAMPVPSTMGVAVRNPRPILLNAQRDDIHERSVLLNGEFVLHRL